jgi:hypothetical protein
MRGSADDEPDRHPTQVTKRRLASCGTTRPNAPASILHERVKALWTVSEDQLLFSIGFAIGQQRDPLRPMLTEHVTDATREQLAKRAVEHLELSGLPSSTSNCQALRSTNASRL